MRKTFSYWNETGKPPLGPGMPVEISTVIMPGVRK